jgi:hypothetical protein
MRRFSSLTEAMDPYKARSNLEKKKDDLDSQLDKISNTIMKLKLPRDAEKYKKLDKEQDKLLSRINTINKKLNKLPPAPINSLWKTKPPKGNSYVTRLFGKSVSTKKVSEGLLAGEFEEVMDLFVSDSIESGNYYEYYPPEGDFDINDIPSEYHTADGVDWESLEGNPKDFKKFTKKFESSLREGEWKNVRDGMSGSANAFKSEHSIKDLTIKVKEGSEDYFLFSHKIYYVNVNSNGSPDFILISKKNLDEFDIASTVERMIFDEHKSMKGKYK